MPSRQFYIQQSCLNTARGCKWGTPAQYLSYMTHGGVELPSWLAKDICGWFRAKVIEYGAPE